jgi:hypothetical protein
VSKVKAVSPPVSQLVDVDDFIAWVVVWFMKNVNVWREIKYLENCKPYHSNYFSV